MPRRLMTSPRKAISAPRIHIRSRKLGRLTKPDLEPIELVQGLNSPESRIHKALRELKIRFQVQRIILGGSVLGGARADFILTDYRIDLEYRGPFHGIAEGKGRDILRDIGIRSRGYRVVPLFQHDLPRLKPRLLEVIGKPVMVGVGT